MLRARRLIGAAAGVVVVGLGLAAPLRADEAQAGKALFNGKDLTGWVAVLAKKGADPKATWEVKDEVLICKGSPNGYVRTAEEYGNYVLKLEWRYPRPKDLKSDGDFKGNSGVLVHAAPPDKIWPKCVEVQLYNPGAGSIFPISGAKGGRLDVKNRAKPVGEWNSYEITCKGGTISVVLNGEKVGQIDGVEPTKGFIGLQSEGAEIHFRKIKIQTE